MKQRWEEVENANLIRDNIPQSITGQYKELKRAINFFFLQATSIFVDEIYREGKGRHGKLKFKAMSTRRKVIGQLICVNWDLETCLGNNSNTILIG